MADISSTSWYFSYWSSKPRQRWEKHLFLMVQQERDEWRHQTQLASEISPAMHRWSCFACTLHLIIRYWYVSEAALSARKWSLKDCKKFCHTSLFQKMPPSIHAIFLAPWLYCLARRLKMPMGVFWRTSSSWGRQQQANPSNIRSLTDSFRASDLEIPL